MTYSGFLLRFLLIPILLLMLALWRDARRGRALPPALRNWPGWLAVAAHALVALLYTTPWDNYLVATRVWWYAPELVTGALIGYVPVEEYAFFVLQPILTGLWVLFLARRVPPSSPAARSRQIRWRSAWVVAVVWLAALVKLLSDWGPGTYLGLLLVWALPPVIFQLAFGADILWRYRRLALFGLLVPTLYLSAADGLAIEGGTWTINPEQSLNLLLVGVLPVEEAVFFLLTNVLIVFGMILVLARASAERLPPRLRERLSPNL